MPKGAAVHCWGINSRSTAMSGIRMKGGGKTPEWKKRNGNHLTSGSDPLTIYVWGRTFRGASKIQQGKTEGLSSQGRIMHHTQISLVALLEWSLLSVCLSPSALVFLPGSLKTSLSQQNLGLGLNCIPSAGAVLQTPPPCTCTCPAQTSQRKTPQIGERSKSCCADVETEAPPLL